MSFSFLIVEDSESYYDSLAKDLEKLNLKNCSLGITSKYTPVSYIEKIEKLAAKPDILFVDYALEWSSLEITNGEELTKEIIKLYDKDLPCVIFISQPEPLKIKEVLYEYQFLPGVWAQALDKSEFQHIIKETVKTKLQNCTEAAIQFLKDRIKKKGEVEFYGLYNYPDILNQPAKDDNEQIGKYQRRILDHFKLGSKETIAKKITNENFLTIIFKTADELMAIFLYENDTLFKYLKFCDNDTPKTHWLNILKEHGIEYYENDVLIYSRKFFWETDGKLRPKNLLLEKQLQQFVQESSLSIEHPFKKIFKKIQLGNNKVY